MDPTSEDLKKLTVPQLKALCKERKLTGYSKLQKNVLIQKLLAASSSNLGSLSPSSISVAPAIGTTGIAVQPNPPFPSVPQGDGRITQPDDTHSFAIDVQERDQTQQPLHVATTSSITQP